MPEQRTELEGLILTANKRKVPYFITYGTYGTHCHKILRLSSQQNLRRISCWNSVFIAIEDEINTL